MVTLFYLQSIMSHDRDNWNIVFTHFLNARNNKYSLTYMEEILVYYSCKYMTLTFWFVSILGH